MARLGCNGGGSVTARHSHHRQSGNNNNHNHQPQWCAPPPPPPLTAADSNLSCDTNRDGYSSQDDTTTSSGYRAIPAYWRKQGHAHQHNQGQHNQGHSHHHHGHISPSDGLSSPVYQSPLPEEQRLYYEPAPQIIVASSSHHQTQQQQSLLGSGGGGGSTAGTLPRVVVTSGGGAGGLVTHSPSPTSAPLPPGLHGCGGHCVAFESFCHYCLQVSFVAGILTGVSLCIAGGVLRGGRGSGGGGGDLLVLVYIGALSAMVSSLLLAVQCCVRRQVEARKRALATRPTRTLVANHPATQHIQMSNLLLQQQLAPSSSAVANNTSSHQLQHHHPPSSLALSNNMAATGQPQLQPLLARLVQQSQHGSHMLNQQQSREPLLMQHNAAAAVASGSAVSRVGDASRLTDWELCHNTLPRGGTMGGGSGYNQSMTLVNCHRGNGEHYRSNQLSVTADTADHNGVPWWRRDESRH